MRAPVRLAGQYDLVGVVGPQGQPGQTLELLGGTRQRAVASQRRMGHYNARDFAEADGNDGRVLDDAHLDGAIDSLGREVGRAIMQYPFDADVRVARQVLAERSDQLVLACCWAFCSRGS